MLQDASPPFYYRGQFNLILSGGDADPVGYLIRARVKGEVLNKTAGWICHTRT
jgi:hypothetical protein